MKLKSSKAGAALIMALTCAGVLAGLGAAAFFVIESKYRVVHQAASWDESLLSAEAGVEMAMNEIRKDLLNPGSAWVSWNRSADPIPGALDTATSTTTATETMAYYMTSEAIVRQGEGGVRSRAEVTVDAPLHLRDRTGEQWYRIRAAGICDVPGGRIAAGAWQDSELRKFDLVFNRKTNKRVDVPSATRVIEAIAKPVGAFRLALFGTSSVNLNNHNILVDSYDSRDPEKSRNGFYPYDDLDSQGNLKRQENGDVATNGALLQAGNARIYGDAMTNGGTVLNAQNVKGEVRNDFFQEVFLVTRPTFEASTINPLVAVNGSTTIDAGTGNGTRYQLSSVQLSGSEELRIRGASGGAPTYVQIVVTGNVSLSGQAQIRLDPNVYARIFVVGDADISGNGFVNPNKPTHLQIYGCDRPLNPDGTRPLGNLKIAGNGGFSGCVYAPNYNVSLVGGGNTENVFGAFVGHTVTMTGVSSMHYDEALADGGLISDYKIVSWFEDER